MLSGLRLLAIKLLQLVHSVLLNGVHHVVGKSCNALTGDAIIHVGLNLGELHLVHALSKQCTSARRPYEGTWR